MDGYKPSAFNHLATPGYNGVGGWIRTTGPRRATPLAGERNRPLCHTDISMEQYTGFEPVPTRWKRVMLAIKHQYCTRWYERMDSDHRLFAYQAKFLPLNYARICMVGAERLELSRTRHDILSVACLPFHHAPKIEESAARRFFMYWSWRAESNHQPADLLANV